MTNQIHDDPAEIAANLGHQVEKWYNGEKEKRDEIVSKLRETGNDDLANTIIHWFEMGNKRFQPLIQKLYAFKK